MRLSYATPALAGLFLLLSGCATAPPPLADTRDADIKSLKDLEKQWNAEWLAKDVDKVVAHYTDDAVIMSPGMPAASTADARKAMVKGLAEDAAGSLMFASNSVEVAKSGDIGTTRGTYMMSMTDPATKKKMDDHGSYVTVYKKQADGTWKAFSDINVSEVPSMPMPAKK